MNKSLFAICTASLLIQFVSAPGNSAQNLTPRHAMTLGDKPKYGPDFKHLDYVNPNAPKGGEVHLYSIGGFDSFNPYIIKGDPATGSNLIFETLMSSTADDSLSEYGLIAESVEVPDDLSYVIYNLRKEAKFHDGSPITADDVVFSFTSLKTKGQPFYRYYYANVSKAEKLSPHRVKFSFSGPPNRELPQIVGQLPVLSKAWWSKNDFSKTTLKPPLGSGPYKVKSFEPGRFIVYERVKNYWGQNIPLRVGQHNFDIVRYDYYRDQAIALEAFKAGLYDFRFEGSSKDWATGYNFPARKRGNVKTALLKHSRPVGMQAFAFNTRRPQFKSKLVRQALAYAFDFEWSNRQLFYGQYSRTTSYFENSDLAATALPTAEELKILEPLRGKVPDEIFKEIYKPAKTDGSGNNRRNLRNATRLLKKAGWKIINNQLVSPTTGKPMEIEFLLVSPAFERVVSPFIRNLKRLGIKGRIRTVDPAQYQNRVRDFDYDAIVSTFAQSLSPGNEQRNYWNSKAANRAGSRNLIGIQDPAIDILVEKIVAAKDRKSLVVASRALDRVLQWNHFVVPQWHIRADRIAWWDKFGQPAKRPSFGIGFFSWWVDVKKAAMVQPNRQKSEPK
jgi:microcin C transport system substrate-binding protein